MAFLQGCWDLDSVKRDSLWERRAHRTAMLENMVSHPKGRPLSSTPTPRIGTCPPSTLPANTPDSLASHKIKYAEIHRYLNTLWYILGKEEEAGWRW